MNHYMCDRCGNYCDAYTSETCPVCHSQAIWQFPPGRDGVAREHAARVFENRANIDAPHAGVWP